MCWKKNVESNHHHRFLRTFLPTIYFVYKGKWKMGTFKLKHFLNDLFSHCFLNDLVGFKLHITSDIDGLKEKHTSDLTSHEKLNLHFVVIFFYSYSTNKNINNMYDSQKQIDFTILLQCIHCIFVVVGQTIFSLFLSMFAFFCNFPRCPWEWVKIYMYYMYIYIHYAGYEDMV